MLSFLRPVLWVSLIPIAAPFFRRPLYALPPILFFLLGFLRVYSVLGTGEEIKEGEGWYVVSTYDWGRGRIVYRLNDGTPVKGRQGAQVGGEGGLLPYGYGAYPRHIRPPRGHNLPGARYAPEVPRPRGLRSGGRIGRGMDLRLSRGFPPIPRPLPPPLPHGETPVGFLPLPLALLFGRSRPLRTTGKGRGVIRSIPVLPSLCPEVLRQVRLSLRTVELSGNPPYDGLYVLPDPRPIPSLPLHLFGGFLLQPP